MGKLQGRTALITGSGRGIGKALALKLASEGANLVINDLDETPAMETVREIEALGSKAVACVGSVTDVDFPDRFVSAALSTFGGLDIMVSNAGYTRDGVIQKMDDAQFQEMLDVHLIAPFRILRAAAEPIRTMAKQEAQQGQEIIRKVVLISSMAGTHGNPGQVNYSAAKAALVGVTKTMSKEWGRYKVCVNCAAFGFIETRLTKSYDDPESIISIGEKQLQAGVPTAVLDSLSSSVPLGRAGTAQEAAGAVSFLCSPESDYVSGQVLIVGGGISF